MTNHDLNLDPAILDRFARDLDALIAPGARIGIAVSGGPDSLALLLLAAGARPGQIEAATVDHALRPGSRTEAELVAELCGRLGVPHNILTARWNHIPTTAIQEKARNERYRLLGGPPRRRRDRAGMGRQGRVEARSSRERRSDHLPGSRRARRDPPPHRLPRRAQARNRRRRRASRVGARSIARNALRKRHGD